MSAARASAVPLRTAAPRSTGWRRRRLGAGGWLGAALLAGLLAIAAAGDGVSAWSFDEQEAEHRLEGPSARHWMGTDALGRDLWARVAEGARVSMLVAVGSTALALVIGVAYGAIAGYVGGRLDGVLMRAVDVLYSLPDVLLIVLLTTGFEAALGGVPDLYRRLAALLLALALVSWVGVARLVRGLVLQAREEAWVEAARAAGARPARILLRHILPNVSGPILVTATFSGWTFDSRAENVVGPELQAANGRGAIVHSSNHDRRHFVAVVFLDLLQKLDTRHAGQGDVEDQ